MEDNLDDVEPRRDETEVQQSQIEPVGTVDPDLVVAVNAHDVATDNSQTEEAQAQQNLQRILALYSAGAAGGDVDSVVDGVAREDGQDAEQDVHMQDVAGNREEGADFLAYLARETRRT